MKDVCKVKYKDMVLEFESGTTYKEISERFKKFFKYEILVARVDNDTVDLSETVSKNCNVEFYDRTSFIGNQVYIKSVQFILILAVKSILGESAEVTIERSIDDGIYCTIENANIDKEVINRIYLEMLNIVKENYIYTKMSVKRIDAIKYFKKQKRYDKVNLLKYISNTYINLYRINDIYDYFHSKMAYSTSQIDSFKLNYISDNGFALLVPSIYSPDTINDYVHHKKLFDAFANYINWGKTLGVNNASDLNKIVSSANVTELVNLSEAYYNSQLTRIADEICNKNSVKVVLIAGPSSSGKTTTSKKLDIYLRSKGFHTHPISLDDYFIDLDKRPKDKNGNPDLESVRAIDIELFNEQLKDLLEGKKVSLPTYNFVLAKREYNGNYLQLGENDIIIIEGLHALNNLLTESISSDKKYKIYISPLTQLNLDNHNLIHTTDVRKLRRIVRDNKTRGHSARETLRLWRDISEGEKENIFQFQDEVDTVVNSSLIYEIGVLKTYTEPLLFNVSETDPEYVEALRLINFLRNFLPIPSDDVPADSVLREFIGGGCFKL